MTRLQGTGSFVVGILLLAAVSVAWAAVTWTGGDIGAVQASGSYTQSGGTFTVRGSGADIWGTADEFQFVSTALVGDGSITARVVSQTNTNGWAKAGVMIRETLAAGSTYAAVEVTPAQGVSMQDRTLTNSNALSKLGPFTKAPYWVRVVRSGSTFSGYASADGVTWKLINSTTITMASQVFMGMVVCSHANGTLSTAVFDSVTATSGTAPPPDTQAPTVPTGLSTSNVTASTLTLSWSASTDLPNPGGTGVGGYYVYRNGNTTTPIATVTGGTSFNDSGLAAATSYTYQVAAFDKASPVNISAASAALKVTTQNSGGGTTWTSGDVGAVQASGSYTQSGGSFTVSGSGADIWGTADEFQFVSTALVGDGSITARVVSQTNTNRWAKAGVMIRETLAPGSTYAAVMVTPGEGSAFQARTVTNGSAVSILGPFIKAPYWVRVVRSGSTFTGYASADGVTWKLITSTTITMATQVYVGLIVSSHNDGVLSTAVFDNVQAPVGGQGAVSVTPRNAALTFSQSQQFTAGSSGGGSVAWSVDGVAGGNSTVGTISPTGLYVPPAAAGTHTVKATSTSQSTNFATAAVAITDLAGIYTYHVDLARTGQNTHEYALTPATVQSPNFGKRWSCALDGDVYAQPLYVAHLAIGGGTHNVLFVVTMHDSVYAMDADNSGCVTYWHVSFLGTGITSVSSADNNCTDVPGEYGITGTPVIDPTSRTIYLVSLTKESGAFVQRLHALNIQTGAEQANSPVVIQGSVTGAGGKTVTFSALQENQRGGLVLSNGGLYITWASHCDNGPWWGWLMRYDATSLAQTAVFNTTPDGSEGGIWMAGGAPAVDSTGSLFFSTGNGTFDDTGSLVPPVAPRNDFGESFLKINPSSLTVEDFYTPSQEATWSNQDLDIASSGVIVLPDGAGPSGHPNVLVGSDKQGHLWMIDRTQMSRFSSTSDNVVQFLTLPPGCADECVFGTPAFWNDTVYFGIGFGNVVALPLSGGLIPAGTGNVAAPSSHSTEKYGFPSPTPMISASPAGGGLVWALDNQKNGSGGAALGAAVLRAYDATNLSKTVYDSSAASDTPGNAVKFTVPVVANGHVYVGGRSQLTVYGLTP